jgi:sporulation protein YlmC with PRC-barrel domain
MLTKKIVGTEVIASNGFKLGEVEDIEFSEKDWIVSSLEVRLEKEVAEAHNLRHRFKKTRVLIHVDHIQAVGDRIILKESKEDLLKLIASTTTNVPEEDVQVPVEAPPASQTSNPMKG